MSLVYVRVGPRFGLLLFVLIVPICIGILLYYAGVLAAMATIALYRIARYGLQKWKQAHAD